MALMASLTLAAPTLAQGVKQQPIYDALRLKLLQQGYKPVIFERGEKSPCQYHEACSVYPETQACAPTGSAGCEMFFSKGAETLRIYTAGDALGRMLVTNTKKVSRKEITEPHKIIDSD
jgi:hypothetical protein